MTTTTVKSVSIAAALAALAPGAPVSAQEVTLRAVSAFADGTTFSRNFQRMVEQVNETGKGVLQIDYRGGGGKVMDPFQLGDALGGLVLRNRRYGPGPSNDKDQ